MRDRTRAFGQAYTRRIRAMGIRDHPTAPRSPRQNGHVERLIGSIRRECLDHVIVFGETPFAPDPQEVCLVLQPDPNTSLIGPEAPDFQRTQRVGTITAIQVLGGLHDRYVRV